MGYIQVSIQASIQASILESIQASILESIQTSILHYYHKFTVFINLRNIIQ